MRLTVLLIACLLTLAHAGLDCFSFLKGGPPAFSPIARNCRNAVQRIRYESIRDPEAQVFSSTGMHARKLPYTWYNTDCVIMVNTQDYPHASGRVPILLRIVADVAENIISSCLDMRGWRIGGETTIGQGVVISVAGSYPGTVATRYGYRSTGALEGIGSGMGNGTEPLPSTTLVPVATQGVATS